MSDGLLLALPKGRIARELVPLLKRAGIEPEAAFADDDARQLRFATSDPALGLIQVRSFDVATFVAFGAAQLGVVGNDVLMEFDYREIYAPLDLRHRPLPHGGGGARGTRDRGTIPRAGATCGSPPSIRR